MKSREGRVLKLQEDLRRQFGVSERAKNVVEIMEDMRNERMDLDYWYKQLQVRSN